MEPLDDFRLDSGPEPPPLLEPEQDSWPTMVIIAILLVLVAVAIAVVVMRRPATDTSRSISTAPNQVQARPREPLGPAVEPAVVPSLDLSDPFVRQALQRLSSRPELAAWLATDGLIRSFVVSVENVATGQSPVRHLRVLAPAAPFAAERRGADFVIDPRSFARYDGLADTLASMDPGALARLYSTLKPRLVEAYKDLGHPEGDIDGAIERAFVLLLQVPVAEGMTPLRQGVLSYKFNQAELEDLEPAQKHLLRMGPRNVRLVQDQLRAIARELGIPFDRLPPR